MGDDNLIAVELRMHQNGPFFEWVWKIDGVLGDGESEKHNGSDDWIDDAYEIVERHDILDAASAYEEFQDDADADFDSAQESDDGLGTITLSWKLKPTPHRLRVLEKHRRRHA